MSIFSCSKQSTDTCLSKEKYSHVYARLKVTVDLDIICTGMVRKNLPDDSVGLNFDHHCQR